MTLRQLLVRYNWLNIEAALLQEYPAVKKHLAEYEAVYQFLLLLEETDSDFRLHLQTRPGEESHQTEVEVMGRNRIPHISEAQLMLPYCLHFTPWAEWLAMPVSLRSLAHFSETEIIVHCLIEMTRKGFDETTIQNQARQLSHAIDGINAQAGNTASLSWEAVLKQLAPRR